MISDHIAVAASDFRPLNRPSQLRFPTDIPVIKPGPMSGFELVIPNEAVFALVFVFTPVPEPASLLSTRDHVF